MSEQVAFISEAPGKYFDPDNAYGFQCKDLIDAYVERIFGRPWTETIRPGNANVCFNGANPEYFEKIENDPRNPAQVPQYGDVIVWGGNNLNRYGHIAIVISADKAGVLVVQQDGYLQCAAFQGFLGYHNAGTGMVVGWLRPKTDKVIGGEVVTTAASLLTLPAEATKWNVYPENGPYTVGNQVGALNPSLFGGLTYQILGWKAGNTVAIIQTRDFGRVGIYVAKGTGAVIS